MMRDLQLWQIWTRGWGPRDWWRGVRGDNGARWIANLLPRTVALMAFVRVAAATGEAPDTITFESAYKAWEAGAGK